MTTDRARFTQCSRLVMFEDEKLVKRRKIGEIRSNQGSMMEDTIISKLPKELILCNILGRLRTVDAIKTSILSTQWRNLWKLVPRLALHSQRFSTSNDFLSFINKFLSVHKDSGIRKFQLRIFDPHYNTEWLDGLFMDDDSCYVTQWIDVVLSSHKIQHLDFSYGHSFSHGMCFPASIYTCETLVFLRLIGVDMRDSEFVSFPCLKSIYFKHVTWPKVTMLEKFISNAPLLIDLTILRSFVSNRDLKPLHLRSLTLERLYLDGLTFSIQVVVIDAPLLQCLKIKLLFRSRYNTIYSGVSPKVQVNVNLTRRKFTSTQDDLSKRNEIRGHLTNISTMVKDLVISRDVLKDIYQFSNLEPLPQFGYMSCLNVNLCVSKLKWFPTFLESCPNLKSLSMRWHANSKKKRNIRFKSVPKCLLSSLECVCIKTMVSEDAIEVKVVKYFLDNAVILKTLTLKLDSHPRKDDIVKKILNLPRRSFASQLEFI